MCMRNTVYFLVFEWKHSAYVLAPATLMLLALFFYLSGTLYTGNYPWYLATPQEGHGMITLLITIPSFVVLCTILGNRRSLELAQIIDAANGTALTQAVTQMPIKHLLLGCLIGFLYATLVNIPGNALNFFETNTQERSFIVGQCLIWVFLGVLLFYRVRVARAFREASERVPVDIYETTNLKPFAQIGLLDVLTIAAGLVLSTVQSMDFSFRPDNYSKALIILIPAMFFLATYPMSGLHRRMQALKQAELDKLGKLISAADKAIDDAAMHKLEVLLQRRERTSALPTWPVDMAIVQRFLFYIVIPPLAWVGAALVEFAVDQFIG